MNDSSLKNFNFKGWTADQILLKYENVLATREKQITDLSLEIGAVNDKINYLTDENARLQEENTIYKEKLAKKEKLLTQELNNKEIMFMKLDKSEKECDRLIKENQKLKALCADKLQENNNQTKVENNLVNPYTNEKSLPQDNVPTEVDNNINSEIKTNARNKINELKAKSTNMSKLNFADLFNKKEGETKK